MTSPITLLKSENIYPKKRLGQNFLADPSTAEMIITRSNLKPDDVVLEIGAGLGALTIPAAKCVKKIYAVEKDRQLIGILTNELSIQNITNATLINQNILDIDIHTLANNETKQITIIGNLPYNISSQILVNLIHTRNSINSAIIMLQQELARRLTAKPNCKDYGRISVMLQYCGDIKTLAEVKAHLFYPQPKVNSEVIEIKFKRHMTDKADSEALLFSVIKAAFGKRRKTLKNALSGSELNISADTAFSILEASHIDPSRRAETLSVSEFVNLSNALGKTGYV